MVLALVKWAMWMGGSGRHAFDGDSILILQQSLKFGATAKHRHSMVSNEIQISIHVLITILLLPRSTNKQEIFPTPNSSGIYTFFYMDSVFIY